MKVEEIAEAVANLPPDQLARFRRWFTAFEAGRADHAGELDSAASKLGRFAGRAFAEMKRRANNREYFYSSGQPFRLHRWSIPNLSLFVATG